MTTLTFAKFRIIRMHVHALRVNGENVVFNRVVAWKERPAEYHHEMTEVGHMGPGVYTAERWEVVEVLDQEDFDHWKNVHDSCYGQKVQ